MNELILEALRLLLAAELRRDVTQAAGARALVDRIDAMLGVMRQDRETPPPAAYRPHRWHQDRQPWSGQYAWRCDGCGAWMENASAPPSLAEREPCPGSPSRSST